MNLLESLAVLLILSLLYALAATATLRAFHLAKTRCARVMFYHGWQLEFADGQSRESDAVFLVGEERFKGR